MKTYSLTDLFIRAFCYKGVPACSATDTDEGSKSQWNRLEQLGFVEKHTKSGRGILGHDFSYRITEVGREKLVQIVNRGDVIQ